MKTIPFSRFLPLWAGLFVMACSVLAAAEKPNVVLIFIDDMGYGDIGPFGNTVNQTPHLDRMASEGLKLTQFYVSNTACTPSRSALMTGSYAHRIGMDGSVVFPGEKRGLNPDEITIAELLKEQGYATGCFGKWHLGDQPVFLPVTQGFDEYFGIPYSNDMWPGNKRGNPVTSRGPYTPLPVIRQDQAVAYVSDGADQSLLCEVMTDEALRFIRKHQNDKFFLYLPHAYVHGPRYARPAIYEAAGGDVNRSNVEEVDTSVGRILDMLRELKLDKNTLVIFTSDNGGAGGMSMGPLRGGKGGPKYEGHMREPTLTWWPGTIPAGIESDQIAATIDMLPSLATLTGAEVPTDRTIDGRDALDVLLGKPGAKSPHDLLYYENEGIRRANWKLLRTGRPAKPKLELYDLDSDIGETNNLASQHPDLVQELDTLLTAHANRIATDTRPAAFVENAKPIISEPGNLPRLRDYMGLADVKAANQVGPAVKQKTVAPIKTNTSPTSDSLAADDILIADFEGPDYGDWKTTGDAFGTGPARGTLPRQMAVTGFQGKGLVNSFVKQDGGTGTLTSPEIKLSRPWLNFLIGGGGHAGQTCMNLLVDGKVVRTATGANNEPGGSEELQLASWDVAEFAGKPAVIQIVDQHTGGWGHINVDQILQSDSRAAPELVKLEKMLTVDNTHLIVPVGNDGNKAAKVLLGIYDGQTLVQNFNVALPVDQSAHWLAAYPLKQFGLGGKEIRIAPVDGKQLSESSRAGFDQIKIGNETDALASDDYAQPYRNQFHVSTRRGWNNDPNGMVYHEGKYHLYYQHNPFGISWGNMHWGHFESTDLIHWKEKPITLFQKTVKDMMFSGGGFVDFNNSAGLGTDTQFIAFTSTGRGECLAYSKDNGLTFTELKENPVVEHNGRDPKIIWYEPEQKWVMVVYDNSECAETKAIPAAEGAENRALANIAFYESKDLRQWTRAGAFTDPDRHAVYECPEFFELPMEGRAGESRWILLGAQNRYFVGTFNGKMFTKESGPHGTPHGAFYAAQTFSDVPDGRRIQIGWVRTGSYQQKFPNQIVSQSFTLPHEMTLRETSDGLRVFFSPVKETAKLRSEILAQGKDLTAEAANELLQKCQGELSEVVIEFAEGGPKELMINGIDARFDGTSARVFTDRTFNEIYADRGRSYEVRKRLPQKFESTETGFKAQSDGSVKSLTIYRLRSIWTAGEQQEKP